MGQSRTIPGMSACRLDAKELGIVVHLREAKGYMKIINYHCKHTGKVVTYHIHHLNTCLLPSVITYKATHHNYISDIRFSTFSFLTCGGCFRVAALEHHTVTMTTVLILCWTEVSSQAETDSALWCFLLVADVTLTVFTKCMPATPCDELI